MRRQVLATVAIAFGAPCWLACSARPDGAYHEQQHADHGSAEVAGATVPAAPDLKPPILKLSKIPDVGDALHGLPDSRCEELVNSAQGYPVYQATVSKITYAVAVSKNGGTVEWISTDSPNFQTPEGFSVANTIGDLLIKYPNGSRSEAGWGSYVVLPSGWAAREDDAGNGAFDPKSKITMFFKRNSLW